MLCSFSFAVIIETIFATAEFPTAYQSNGQANFQCDIVDCSIPLIITPKTTFSINNGIQKITGKQAGSRYNTVSFVNYTIESKGVITSNSSFTFEKGNVYTVNFNYHRTNFNDTVDLIPSIYGYDFTSLAWWNASWGYVIPITLNSTVAETLTDFPARISISTSNATLWNTTTCTNVRFLNTDNTTVLSYELDDSNAVFCGNATNNATFWVKIPSLTTGNYTIYAYLGNIGAANGQNATDVWGNGYRGVYHFSNTPNYADSLGANGLGTITSTNLTALTTTGTMLYGSEVNVTGAIYKSTNWLAPVSPFGLTLFMKTTATSTGCGGAAYTSDYKGGLGLYIDSSTAMRFNWDGGVGTSFNAYPASAGNIQYTGFRNNATYAGIWLNGILKNSTTTNAGSTTSSQTMNIFSQNYTIAVWQYPLSGVQVSELRYYNSTKTADWFVAESLQTSTVGTVENPPASPVFTVSASSPSDNSMIFQSGWSFSANVSGNVASYNCTLYINNTPSGIGNFINNTINTIIMNNTFTASILQWNITCSNNSITNSSANRTIFIYAIPPTAAEIWAYAARTLTNYNESYIAYLVWQNANRSTSNLTAAEAAYQVWQSANRSTSNLTTSDIPGAIAIAYQVWQNANRSTSNSTANSTLGAADIPTAIQNAYQVWQNANRSTSNSTATSTLISSDIPTAAFIAFNVWQNANRSTSNLTDIQAAYQVWQNINRSTSNSTATSTLTISDIPTIIEMAYAVWQNDNRSTSNLTEAEVLALFPLDYLSALEQEQLLNASNAVINPNITVNMTINGTYNQTSLMEDINGSLTDTYNQAALQTETVSTNLIFLLIFAILSIVMAFLALTYQRTMLWILSGAMFVGLGILLIPMNLIIMICCIGIGFYLWARTFIS